MLIMAPPFPILQQLSDFVAAKLGLGFPPERWRDLERALRPAGAELGFDTLESYARWLLTTPLSRAELESLAARLTVGETYFFREPQAFDILREHIVPEFVSSRRGRPQQFRVWSAGCCTGEEAYSLAIYFHRLCPELLGAQITVLGTDINPHFLRKAREGIYRSWSFRGAPVWLQSGYFTRVGDDQFQLRPEIKRLVEFEPLNLAEDSYPSLQNHTNAMDLIFCRNVLMYFLPAHAQRAIEGFHRSLVDGGHLVVGLCEVSAVLCPQFQARAFPGETIYQKSEPSGLRATRPAKLPFVLPAFAASPPQLDAAPAPEPSPVSVSPVAPTMPAIIEQALERFRDGDYNAAIETLQAALAKGPLDVDAATLLARAHANQGNLTEARRWIERALIVDKLRPALHYLRASVLQEQGERGLAAGALEKALYLDPDFVLAHVALAELADRGGPTEKARRHRAQALRWLRRQRLEDVIPEAEGLTAGRLIAMIEVMQTTDGAP